MIKHAGRVLAARLRRSDVARAPGRRRVRRDPPARRCRARPADGDRRSSPRSSAAVHARRPAATRCRPPPGCCVINEHTVSAEDALVNVDMALYDAKRHGRNRIAVYSPGRPARTCSPACPGPSGSSRRSRTGPSSCTPSRSSTCEPDETVIHELLIRMRAEDGELIAPGRFLPAAAALRFHACDRPLGHRPGGAPGRRIARAAPGGQPRRQHDRRAGARRLHHRDARQRRRRTPPTSSSRSPKPT